MIKNAVGNPKEQQQAIRYRWLDNQPVQDGKYIRHVLHEGNRYHVLYYNSFGRHCNVSNCEINNPPGKEL